MSFSRRDALHILISGAVSTLIFTSFKISGAKALPRPPSALIGPGIPQVLHTVLPVYRCVPCRRPSSGRYFRRHS